MFGKVQDDSFTHIFDLSLDSEDKFGNSFQSQNPANHYGQNLKMSSTSSSPMSSRRDFSSPSSTISTPSSTSSLPLEAAFSQFAASFSSLLADKDAAASAASSLDKKISELERLRNKINHANDSHSSASSTTSNGSTSASNSKVNTSRYKTELCRPFSEHGTCKYGEKCQFAHGMAELRTVARHPKYKTDLCRTYHSVGFCPYGPRCHFIHNLEEAKEQERQKASKAIGSGRNGLEVAAGQTKPLKPLPMFDRQQPPSGNSWNPLNSNLFNEQIEAQQKSRLPVFSTLSK